MPGFCTCREHDEADVDVRWRRYYGIAVGGRRLRHSEDAGEYRKSQVPVVESHGVDLGAYDRLLGGES